VSEEERAWPCKMTADGLKPCHAMNDVLEIGGVGTRYQGVKLQTLINMKSGDFSRHLVVLKSGKHAKKGLVFNLCPFCGEELYEGAKAAVAESCQLSSQKCEAER
jgi:hypothetical protein